MNDYSYMVKDDIRHMHDEDESQPATSIAVTREPNEDLEAVLREIWCLSRDLKAEIVIQEEAGYHVEEQGHWDSTLNRDAWSGFIRPNSNLPSRPPTPEEIRNSEVWVIDQREGYILEKPRIAKPDTQKRDDAREALQQIYDFSEWYSARYTAGKNLGLIKAGKDSQIEKWINELKSDLNATTSGEPYVEPYKYPGDGYMGLVCDYCPDTETREKAEHDLKKLISLLDNSEKQELYHHSDSDIRKRVGKSLGYSDLKIWADENPVKAKVSATAAAVAGAGAVSGLGYMLYQYMVK